MCVFTLSANVSSSVSSSDMSSRQTLVYVVVSTTIYFITSHLPLLLQFESSYRKCQYVYIDSILFFLLLQHKNTYIPSHYHYSYAILFYYTILFFSSGELEQNAQSTSISAFVSCFCHCILKGVCRCVAVPRCHHTRAVNVPSLSNWNQTVCVSTSKKVKIQLLFETV